MYVCYCSPPRALPDVQPFFLQHKGPKTRPVSLPSLFDSFTIIMSYPLSNDDSKYTWDRHPQRRPPPAVTIPPPSPPNYSPDSPSHLHHARSQSEWTNTLTVQSYTKDPDPEAGKQPTTPQPSRFRERFTKYFFDLRMPTQGRDPEWVPMSEPPLQQWPPLEIEKKRRCHHCQEENDRRRKLMAVLIVMIVVLLFLFGNIIFLNVRVVRLSASRSSSPSSPSNTSGVNTSTSNGLSEDAQQCLSQYTLNAPSDPQGYPCSTCLGVLQQVPSSFFETDQSDGEQITNAIQFCGLRSIFETSSGDGQRGLSNAGWAQDVRFCAWQGVRCDGFGRVASL